MRSEQDDSPIVNAVLHGLNAVRDYIVAYHQMRTGAIIFIAGLATGMVALVLDKHDEERWVWAALVGPLTFLGFVVFLSMYFRTLLSGKVL
jgi:hypothetical protein